MCWRSIWVALRENRRRHSKATQWHTTRNVTKLYNGTEHIVCKMTKPINNRNVSCFGGGGLKKFSSHTKKIQNRRHRNVAMLGPEEGPKIWGGGVEYFCCGHNLPLIEIMTSLFLITYLPNIVGGLQSSPLPVPTALNSMRWFHHSWIKKKAES